MIDSFSLYDSSDVVDIVLYKYNNIDNKLWSKIKNEIEYLEPSDGSIIVPRETLEAFINANFKDNVDFFNAIGWEMIHKEVNSIYFISNMLRQMKHLRWIKFTLNKNRNYSRLVTSPEGDKQIKFGFKILHLTLRTFDILEPGEIEIFNKILIEEKVIEDGIPYRRLKLNDLLGILDEWLIKADKNSIQEISENEIDVIDAISIMLDMMGDPKLSGDNPEVLLVTDY